jgi:glutamine amidotransferase-like uncharacterized protein
VHTTKDREASKAKSSREHILKKHFTKHGKMAHGVHPEFKPRYCKKKKKKKTLAMLFGFLLFFFTLVIFMLFAFFGSTGV